MRTRRHWGSLLTDGHARLAWRTPETALRRLSNGHLGVGLIALDEDFTLPWTIARTERM